ncbi:MAG: hypothetical protein ABSF26_19985 [Thermoguttaceae bacterium]
MESRPRADRRRCGLEGRQEGVDVDVSQFPRLVGSCRLTAEIGQGIRLLESLKARLP